MEAQNFALFFHFSPPLFSFFPLSLSLLGPFVEFWWCLKRRGAEMCTFGVLGLSCEAPAAPKPRSRIGRSRASSPGQLTLVKVFIVRKNVFSRHVLNGDSLLTLKRQRSQCHAPPLLALCKVDPSTWHPPSGSVSAATANPLTRTANIFPNTIR